MANNLPAYKRVLIKISGEALAGESKSVGVESKSTGGESKAAVGESKAGYDFTFIESVCRAIKSASDMGVEVGVVVGGGNLWRGVKDGGGRVERVRADQMGMLATVMNCLALADTLESIGVPAAVLTASPMPAMTELFTARAAREHLKAGRVCVFGGGTGCPYFSTDTAAVLRASEIGAEVVLLAKNIDGVYSADPRLYPAAEKFSEITYAEVLSRRLAVMDSTATSLAMDNGIPVLVFALEDPTNIVRAVLGETVGTRVSNN